MNKLVVMETSEVAVTLIQ